MNDDLNFFRGLFWALVAQVGLILIVWALWTMLDTLFG